VLKQPQRAFTTEFKVLVVQRIESGDRLSAVADEMGIRRKLLYEWRAAYRALGAAGLNRKRGPKRGVERFSVSPRGRASADAPPSARPRGITDYGDTPANPFLAPAVASSALGRVWPERGFARAALRRAA